ncbi:DUF1318 domain-containing protein [Alginatibacterium sediminis]|uniref:DUF1318 domain-containing protein n=1 Tax=Alginatibacterium sediminis TaxID=2164068 RepID=A0A420ENE4_9ALTE|nr:YdbL family protein [Alginatibacterium sediminis]RKF22188.1 DUF1318 domain-containing protein [Alginatibacterium sediminis]
MHFNKILAFLLLALSLQAHALSLDEAKQNGWIGEQTNGLLGIVSHSKEVGSLVTDINTKRLAQYQKIAQQNGLSIDQVSVLAGKKAIERSDSGEYIQNAAGDWIKK